MESAIALAPYLFLLPFALLFIGFMLYPLGRSLGLSFYRTSGARDGYFVGWDNYRYLLKDKLFWLACANTVLFALVLLPLQLIASLGLALLLNRPDIRFRNVFRFAFFSTYLVGQIFLAVLSYLIFSPRWGLLNQSIGAIFPSFGTELNWRGNPNLAMPAIVLATLWVTVGYAMIYWLAALQAVDRELYEAAEVDGAGTRSAILARYRSRRPAHPGFSAAGRHYRVAATFRTSIRFLPRCRSAPPRTYDRYVPLRPGHTGRRSWICVGGGLGSTAVHPAHRMRADSYEPGKVMSESRTTRPGWPMPSTHNALRASFVSALSDQIQNCLRLCGGAGDFGINCPEIVF